MSAKVETLLGPQAAEGTAQAGKRGKGSGTAFARALGQALGGPGRAAEAQAVEGAASPKGALRLRLGVRLEAAEAGAVEAGEAEAASGPDPTGGKARGKLGPRTPARPAPGEQPGDLAADRAAEQAEPAGAELPGAGEPQLALAGAAGGHPGARPAPGKDKAPAENAPSLAALRAAAPRAAEKAAEKAAVARTLLPPPGQQPEAAGGERRGGAAKPPAHQEEEKAASRAAEAAAPGTPAAAPPLPPTLPAARFAEALGLPAAEARGAAAALAAELPAPAPAGAPALRDAAVEGALLRSAAHLRLETPTLGELELHLRIRENTAHLRVEGEGARLLEHRAGELQRALAGEGLKLGSLDLPQPSGTPERSPGGSPEQRPDRHPAREWEEPPPPPPAPAPRRAAPRSASGVHVKA